MKNVKQLLKTQNTVTFTFIGDSITWGLNHCTAEETYVAYFAEEMAKAFPNSKVIRYDGIVKDELSPLLRYDATIIQEGIDGTIHIIRSGVGGNTVARALARKQDFTGVLPSGTKSDYIFTMFGINDALYPDPTKYVSTKIFKQNYRMLLSLLNSDTPNAQTIVMTATTNDIPVEDYVQATYELVQGEAVKLIDLHTLWKNQYDSEKVNFGYGDWLATDACHPTPKSAQIMAQKIFRDTMEGQL